MQKAMVTGADTGQANVVPVGLALEEQNSRSRLQDW